MHVYMYIYLSIYLSIYLCIHTYIYIHVYTIIHPSIYSSIHPSIQAVRASVYRRYCTHCCFWHRSISDRDVHRRLAAFYRHTLALPAPNAAIHANPTVHERWTHAELLWQYSHAVQVWI